MNEKIKEGKLEFEKKNFKDALDFFESVEKDDADYDCAVIYRIDCHMGLNEYGKALSLLDYLIEKNPYEDIFWFEKAKCHMFLEQNKKARNALAEIERIVDAGDKRGLLRIAKLYNWLGDDENALKYCDMALGLDENYKEALHEKSLVAVGLKDDEMMNDVADRLLEVNGEDFISMLPAFQLRLFSKNYRGCIDLIRSAETDESLEDSVEMFKVGLYNKMCEGLNAQILVSGPIDLSVDEAIDLMVDFHESGKDHGEVKGIQYFIL